MTYLRPPLLGAQLMLQSLLLVAGFRNLPGFAALASWYLLTSLSKAYDQRMRWQRHTSACSLPFAQPSSALRCCKGALHAVSMCYRAEMCHRG